ncbi:MAG: tetratricopeptide repeat protein, partial [Planctomycetes bacterium]|nr:tetratricopeptide repeat protein [Planctomycetota bacterium]
LDDWLYALADAYHHAGQYKEAIANYRQCGKHYPHTHFQMAACHRALKEFNEAMLTYGGIIRSDKNHAPSAQLEIARTLEEQGQKDKAILAFQKVCKEYPTSNPASVAHAHLQTTYKITVTLGGAKKD